MVRRRNTIILTIFILAETLLSFYIFTYTARNKSPSSVWGSPVEICCLDFSYTGDSIVSGLRDGRIYLIQGKTMSTRLAYSLDEPPSIIKMSKIGNYFASLDDDGNLALFSNVPLHDDGAVRPLWVKEMPGARLLDVYSNEGTPPLVYILVSRKGSLTLIQRDGATAWEHDSTGDSVSAAFSLDGSWIAAVDSGGEVYLFNRNSPSVVWEYSSRLSPASVSIALRGEHIAVAGKRLDGGAGRMIMLSRRTGEPILQWDFGEAVMGVSISADGGRVYVHRGNESISTLNVVGGQAREQTINVEGGLEYFATTPYSLYVAGVSSAETVYLYYLNRPGPLWRFSPGSMPDYVSMSQDGDTVFVGTKDSIYMLQNHEFSEMIPGSRFYWSITFFSSMAGIFLLFFAGRTLEYFRGIGGLEASLTVLVTVAWFLAGIILFEELWRSSLFSVGVFLGGVVYLKGRRLSSSLVGAYVGCLGSAAGGLIGSMITWFRGSETSVFSLGFIGVAEGLRMGALSGFIGSVSGMTLLALYHKVYAR